MHAVRQPAAAGAVQGTRGHRGEVRTEGARLRAQLPEDPAGDVGDVRVGGTLQDAAVCGHQRT